MVGEIGGNDHNYAAFASRNITQLLPNVPLVVEAITKATSVCYTKQSALYSYQSQPVKKCGS